MECKTNSIPPYTIQQFQAESSNLEKIPQFPPEIIEEILLRLPVKSLLKFRCVSKSWLCLISSSNFSKTHLEYSTKCKSRTHRRFILTVANPFTEFKECSLHSLRFNLVSDAVSIDYPMKSTWNSICVVGSCNGLLCITIDKNHFFLWNPATRKSHELPDWGVKMLAGYYFTYGFGFDESNDDYKVVKILSCFRGTTLVERIVKVYSLKTGAWKRIEDFDGKFLEYVGKFANGKLHWPMRYSDILFSEWDVVSLDLKTEVYEKIALPFYGDSSPPPMLGAIGGCLSVVKNYWDYGDLWILKNYGSKKSWIKMFSIYVDKPSNYVALSPLYLLNNGEVLLLFGSDIVIYNPEYKSLRYPTAGKFIACYDANIYIEGLVSPIPNDGGTTGWTPLIMHER